MHKNMDGAAGLQAREWRNSHLAVILSSCVERGILQLQFVPFFCLNTILYAQTNVHKQI